ncbi:MAG TPA: hypothetical protein VFO60_00755 [Candidatus Dormibacteraeota bacterium]|nr:hypothetical protein [Candidatus Dormibacteraeota bacterium]
MSPTPWGIGVFRTLAATGDRDVVLCTDLHAGNVLAAERERWLIIDPKPRVAPSGPRRRSTPRPGGRPHRCRCAADPPVNTQNRSFRINR